MLPPPLMYSQNVKDLHYSFGWAQMESQRDLIMKFYGKSRGKAAEYW